MANPAFGVNASNEQIGIVLGAIPLIARLLSTKVWGYLFDHFNLISLRIALNVISFFSTLLFFFTSNLLLMSIAMVFFGMAFGGGRIMWQLWVTKIAPDDKVASYMAVNTAATGIQGLVAPVCGYLLLHFTNPSMVGWISALFIAVSTFIFMPARVVLARRT
jgi:predicted MFS family arabinose efflux permease